MPEHELRQNPAVALLIGIVAWLVPGSGHALLRQWGRGLGVFCAVGALAWIGVAVRGRLFTTASSDFFDLLGYVADCGAGVFFFLAQQWSNGGPDVAHAAGDYGTRFFAAAGVLNILAAVDAYRLARGQEPHHDEDEEAAVVDARLPGDTVHEGADPASELQLSDPEAEPAASSATETTPAPAEFTPGSDEATGKQP